MKSLNPRIGFANKKIALSLGEVKLRIMKLLLWLILLVICWPLAIGLFFLYPLIWLFLLPFRLVGFAVEGVFAFIRALFMLPARVLS
ncbi:hypothetical protein [Reichenbachiella sp.]|uniref:hypothetical protein n=1 Tax=Reichenbachiella sp. TaxID=2184521 RepID=UPI003B5BE28A